MDGTRPPPSPPFFPFSFLTPAVLGYKKPPVVIFVGMDYWSPPPLFFLCRFAPEALGVW